MVVAAGAEGDGPVEPVVAPGVEGGADDGDEEDEVEEGGEGEARCVVGTGAIRPLAELGDEVVEAGV